MNVGAEFAEESICLYFDDINKIHLGTSALSRYHQSRTLFPLEDISIYIDHDILFRNSSIFPQDIYIYIYCSKSQPIEAALSKDCATSVKK